MTTYAYIANHNGDPISDDYLILNDDAFEEIENIAKEENEICCIKWHRTTDDCSAYYSPAGVSFQPFWYNVNKTKKLPI